MTSLASWFFKKRALAFGLMASGSSIGGIVLPIMIERLLPVYGFAWTMRLAAFVILGLLVFSKSRENCFISILLTYGLNRASRTQQSALAYPRTGGRLIYASLSSLFKKLHFCSLPSAPSSSSWVCFCPSTTSSCRRLTMACLGIWLLIW